METSEKLCFYLFMGIIEQYNNIYASVHEKKRYSLIM